MRAIVLLSVFLSLPGPLAAEGFRTEATAPIDSVPSGMNYQGRLEKDGFPVSGTPVMAFKLYDAPAGGTLLWDSGNQATLITQGLFSAVLDIPFAQLAGSAQKYLEIVVDGVTLSPRDPVRSVPYAKIAETVEGSIDVSSAGLTFTTPVGSALAISSGSGRVGIGTASPLARLHVASGTLETGNILLVSTGASTLMSVNGNGVVTANSFVGDGTTLGNVVRKSGDGMSGPLTLSGSTLTVTGAAFSVGTLDLVVGSNRVGVRTISPQTTLEVNGNAQFGSDATKSTFATTGALALNTNASLSVGTTFFVNNGRVGINTLSPGTTLQVLGDVYIGDPVVHDLSTESDLIVKGNVIVDGTLIQHGGGAGFFSVLGVDDQAQAGQTFAVGYSSLTVLTGGNVGVGTAAPLSKLSVFGDTTFGGASTFGSSVTVAGAQGVGGALAVTGAVTAGNTLGVAGAVSVGGALSVAGKAGYADTVTFYSSTTVRSAAAFGTGAATTTISAAGGMIIASGQNITLAGAGEVLGLPVTPTVNDAAASKAYVNSQTLAGSGWSAGAGKVELNVISDKVGVGTSSPLSKLSVSGDAAVSGAATFASSVTVRNSASFGTTGQSAFSNTGVLTLGTDLATTEGGTGNSAGTVASLTSDPTDCAANQFANGIAANGNLACAALVDADVPNTITVNLAAAATALNADPAACGANTFANDIAASGALTCAGIVDADVPNTITVNLAAAATALNADPAACGANQFANDIAASGALTCAALVDADVPDTITINAAAVAPNGGLRLFNRTFAQLMAITPTVLGDLYFCSNCGLNFIAVSTGTAAAGQFSNAVGASLQ